jgi:hypothetical protein
MQLEKWMHDGRWPGTLPLALFRFGPFDPVVKHGVEQI